MIRHFDRLDLRRLKPNGFTSTSNLGWIIDDPSFYKQTLEDDETGAVLCVIIFKPYADKNFVGFFLMGQDIAPIHARQLRRFVENVIIDFEMDRLQTDSIDCDLLNRWHKFLGFAFEGTRKKMMMGKDYNMWAIVPERQAQPVDLSLCGGM